MKKSTKSGIFFQLIGVLADMVSDESLQKLWWRFRFEECIFPRICGFIFVNTPHVSKSALKHNAHRHCETCSK